MVDGTSGKFGILKHEKVFVHLDLNANIIILT